MKMNHPAAFLALGLFISLPVTVLAAPGPGITTQPQSQSILTNSNAVFTVVASGQSPLSYQWSFNGANLSNSTHIGGATSATLTVSNVGFADDGNYQVVVSNSHGSIASSNATLTVLRPAAITNQPSSQTVYFGGPASFSVSATGTVPLIYQWYFGGAPLSDNGQVTGSATATLNLSDVLPANLGNYQVIVTNVYGSATSMVVTLNATNLFHYVNINNPTPVPPYANWNTAATNIQDAIDAAVSGDSIFVTNGVYTFGNRITSLTTNCVVVTNAISISSISGPSQTIIDGGSYRRCIYLTNGCWLSGFTLTNGTTPENGGGVFCASTNVIITNCVATGNSCYISGGGVYQGTLINCLLTGNYAGGNAYDYTAGGGAGSSVLYDCTISGNSGGTAGGGLFNCVATQCILTNNYSPGSGAAGQSTLIDCLLVNNPDCGAGDNSTLTNCTLIGNTGTYGGGAVFSTLNNCLLISNTASAYGGGAWNCTLNGCTLVANDASDEGGGVYQSTLYNCDLSNNIAGQYGGGALNSTLSNCVLAANSALSDNGGGASSCTLFNCTLSNNVAGNNNGGADSSVLVNSLIVSNWAAYSGGGVGGSILTNCVLTGNIASGGFGGGAYGGAFYNCLLAGNSCLIYGGGAYESTLINCTVAGNDATNASGGVEQCSLTNSIVYYNNSPINPNYSSDDTLGWCCTTPPPGGVGNISSAPLVVNAANGNFRLSPGSPCIDTGNNAFVPVTVDLDGNPRIVNSTVDIGAYEFQNTPFIEIQPTNQTVPFGQLSVSFSVYAVGPGPLTYQWQFDGTNILGATNSTLTLNFAVYSNAGIYSVLVTNSYGSTSSSNAVLTVVPPTPPSFTTQPSNQIVAVGTNVTLAAPATGAPAPAYQWYFNGVPLADNGHYSGSGTATLQISDIQTNDTGNYFVIATNTGGAVTSLVATVTVLNPPAITLQPASQSLPLNSNVTFTATASGGAPLGYQWYFDGNALTDSGQFSGTATTNLTISNLQFTNIGNYMLVVTNPVGSATSAVAVLTVEGPPMITAPLTNQITMVFSNVIFALSVTGTPSLYYQWQFNGTNLTDGGNISGSSGPSLAISDPQLADSGQYSVTISNAYGTVTRSATLTVVPTFSWGNAITPPAAVTNSIGIGTTIYADYWGSNADFAVQADGSIAEWGNDFNGILDYTPPNDTNFFSISDGAAQVVAIRQDGTVASWGGDGTNVPSYVTNVVAVAVQGSEGVGTGLALQQDGTVVAWNVLAGEPGPPANATNIIAISAGPYGLGGCLAVSQNGTVIGWGENTWGESSPPAQATNVVAVVCGDTHSIALRADGTVVTWGAGANTPPAGATNVIAVAAGTQNDLVLRQDGTVVGWGGLGSAPSFITNVAAIAAEGSQNMVLVQNPNLAVPPQILQQPLGAVVQTNQTLILEGQAVGAAPIKYQWYFNGAPIAGQNNRWLLLSPIQASQGGNYQFVATNNFGSITSLTAVVWTPPVIPVAPAATIVFGSNGVFSVAPIGTAPFGYQWYYNDTPLSDGGPVIGSATADLIISNFQPANLGNYTVVVTNLAGSATSGVATVTVLNPQITSQPQSQSALGGATVTFGVSATGQQPLSYQWQFNGTDLPGATNNPLVLTNVLVSQSGLYSVIVSNDYGIAVSSSASLTVTALSIMDQPKNQSVLAGTTVNFSVSVSGQQPIAYQWLYNGANLPGATNNPLVLSNVLVSQSGLYSVIVTNAYGTSLSSNAVLTVAPLAITAQPTNRITWPYGAATFKVNVAGQPPFGFDWQCNGVDIPGIWTNVLTLTNVQPSQFGTYDVIVSNAWGSVTSSNAVLLFSQVAVWGGSGGESNLTPGLTNIIAIAAGSYPNFDCLALRSNGTAIHWPTTNIFVGATNLLSIAGGSSQGAPPFLVLESNGVVATWLADDIVQPYFGPSNLVAIAPENLYMPLALMTNGTVISPATVARDPLFYASNAVAIAEGSEFGLALKADGTVTAFGLNSAGTNIPPGLSNVVAIAAAADAAFAVKCDGTVAAWGKDGPNLVTFASSLSNVIAIAAGPESALALMTNGTVVAWGENINGSASVPPGLTNVIAIAAGEYQNMALIGNGPPVLSVPLPNPVIGTNGFSFTIPSQSGRVYMLQYLNSLTDSNWISLPLVPGNGRTLLLTDPSPTNSQRFYRVQRW